MGLKALVCHLSCMLVAVSMYGMSGIYQDFEPHLEIAPIGMWVVGMCGIAYCTFASQERAIVTFAKLSAYSIQWFCLLFGGVLAVYSLTKSPWCLYLVGAILCFSAYFLLSKVQSIGSQSNA